MPVSQVRAALAVVALVVFCVLPRASTAQERSVLMLLPTDGRVLEMGGEHQGALSSSDHLSTDDTFLEAWELSGSPGDQVVIDLESGDFDSVLYVVGPGLAATLHDDDGGPGCNSRVSFTILETGGFRVVASSLGARQTGTYTIRVSSSSPAQAGYGCGEADPSELSALATDGRTLSMGSSASGEFSAFGPTVQDGRPAQAWTLEGSAGQRVAIVMESSAFDAFLYLVGGRLDGVLTDDDGAGDLDARLEVTLPSAGTYTVVASSITDGASGSYSIRVEEPVDLLSLPTDGRLIEAGQTRSGVLGFGEPIVLDGRAGQIWELSGEAGQQVTIDLSSEELDSYLYFFGPGIAEPLSDDDGGGDLNSRIATTLPESGSYRVVVSQLGESSGAFTLSVTAR